MATIFELMEKIPIEVVKNLDKHFDEILDIYPEFKDFIEQGKKQLVGCTNCQKGSMINKIITAIASMGGYNRNLDKISFLGEPFLAGIRNKNIKDFDLSLFFFNKRTMIYPSMRKSCLDCCRKHIGMAIIYLEEYISDKEKYKFHYDDAVAHLAHVEVEAMERFPSLSKSIRIDRLSMIDNYYETFPDLRRYYHILNNLYRQQ